MVFLVAAFETLLVENFWSFVLFQCQLPPVLLKTTYEAATVKSFSPFFNLLGFFFFNQNHNFFYILAHLYFLAFSLEFF